MKRGKSLIFFSNFAIENYVNCGMKIKLSKFFNISLQHPERPISSNQRTIKTLVIKKWSTKSN